MGVMVERPQGALPVRVKVCGLSKPEHLAAAVEAGAAYVGFVFFEKSPRNVTVGKGTASRQTPHGRWP
jgi:phosphoribosylanthranilate isomerase